MTMQAPPKTYDLGPAERIPLGEGRVYQIGPSAIAVFRTRDGVFATQAACPHRGGPLADGIVGGGKVVCPLHSFRFDLGTGQALGSECPNLKTYPAGLNGAGHILLEL